MQEKLKDQSTETCGVRDPNEPRFIRNSLDEKTTKRVLEIVAKFNGNIVSTKFPNYIKTSLEKEFGEGWNVFAGKHFSGVCRFIEGCFAEFEIGDNIVVIFKSYMPSLK